MLYKWTLHKYLFIREDFIRSGEVKLWHILCALSYLETPMNMNMFIALGNIQFTERNYNIWQ